MTSSLRLHNAGRNVSNGFIMLVTHTPNLLVPARGSVEETGPEPVESTLFSAIFWNSVKQITLKTGH